MWRRSYIRQSGGATRLTGSPEVKALGGQTGTELSWSGQHRGQTSRRAVAKANGLTAEISFRTKLIQAGYTECQELPPFTRWPVPMRKKWGYARIGLPADVEDGNSGQSCSESSEGSGDQTGGSSNVKS